MAQNQSDDIEEQIKETVLAEETAEAVQDKVGASSDADSGQAKAAKAGKRSKKSQEQAEAKRAKEARKEAERTMTEEEKAQIGQKQAPTPARSRLERQGKKFREASKLVDKTKQYTLKEAIELAQKTSPVKFDASVELHVNLNVNPKHADQNIRGTLVLPAGTGKSVRVAVFDDAKVEGADLSGVETITAQLEKGELNFDVLISTPANMPKLGKYARTLGPRGLMPNPKSGTVTPDIAKAVKEAKAGRVEYRVDSTGIVHLAIGKASFKPDDLLKNAQAVAASLKSNKPASVKGTYVKSAHLSTSMGPSTSVAISEF
jgi:large subunit ribosomal protein L1